MSGFTLKDVGSESVLRISGAIPRGLMVYDGCEYRVSLDTRPLKAAVVVYDIQPESWAAFFVDLATHWRGWEGEKRHESLERHFKLAATSDSVGHIRIHVSLRGSQPDDWSAESFLEVEAGQLEAIARNAQAYFGDLGVERGGTVDPT